MIRMTRLGWLFFILGVLLYLASLTSNSGLLLFFIGLFVGCYILNIIYAIGTVRHLKVIPPKSIQAEEGEILKDAWSVTNLSRRPSGFAQIITAAGPLAKICTLQGGETARLRPEFSFQKRGVYTFSECTLSSSFPFGLLTFSKKLSFPGEAVIYPRLSKVEIPSAAAYDAMVGGTFKGSRRVLSGTHFAGVRPFQPQDPLKNIDWKSSAKGRGVMVKTFEEELSGRIAIIVDVGTREDSVALDENLRLAGSLAFCALDEGHHVEFIDLHERRLHRVPPFSDGNEVLDRLARIIPGSAPLTLSVIEEAVATVSVRSALAFVLSDYSEEIKNFLTSLQGKGRRVSLYLRGAKTSPARTL